MSRCLCRRSPIRVASLMRISIRPYHVKARHSKPEARLLPVSRQDVETRTRASAHHSRNATASRRLLAACGAILIALSPPLHGRADANAGSEKRLDFPEQISSTGEAPRQDLGKLIRGKKGKEIQDCSRKCIPTCLRGGEGAPGLGPMTVRRELVIFKEGYRDRKYCLTECTTVCALSFRGDGTKE